MKTFLKIILIIVFVVLTPSFVSGLATRLGKLSPSFIKETFLKHDIYRLGTGTVADLAIEQSDLRDFGAFIKREVTLVYLQSKVENFIDSVDAWASGKTKQPPSISFSELKDRLTMQNPQLLTELKSLSQELKKQGSAEAGQVDLESFLASDFKIAFQEKDLTWIKVWYWNANLGLFVIAFFMFGVIVALYYLSDPLSSKLRWIASCLMVTSFSLIPSLIFVFIGSSIARGLIGESPDLPKFIWPFLEDLFGPFLTAYLKIGLITSVVFLIASIICFAIASKKTSLLTKTA